jgi:hypothetical protein
VNAILDEALIGHFGFVDSQLSEGYPMGLFHTLDPPKPPSIPNGA